MGASSSRKPSDAEERLLNPAEEEDVERDSGPSLRHSTGARGAKKESSAGAGGVGADVGAKEGAVKEKKHSSFGRVVSLARPELFTLSIATVALVVGTTCGLAQPLFFGKIIEAASSDDDDTDGAIADLNRYAVLLLIILAVGSVATVFRGWLYTLVGERLVRTLRADLFAKIVNQDISFFDSNKTGELMNRLSSDTTVIQNCLSVNISMGLRAVAEIVVSIALLFITSWQLTAVMMAVVPALMVIVIIYGSFTKKLTMQYQDALAKAADIGAEL